MFATWGKNLNELNCHLHPLDTVATAIKVSLAQCGPETGQLFGNDCIAGNLVLQINKFRYKDGKGDRKGFVTFLYDEGLARGILPLYHGNRLHILFHTCGKLFEHHHLFLIFFNTGTITGPSASNATTSVVITSSWNEMSPVYFRRETARLCSQGSCRDAAKAFTENKASSQKVTIKFNCQTD